MDLDDSFVERLARKNKTRKQYVGEKAPEVCSVGKKRVALVEENQLNTDGPSEESPKRQCTEILQSTYSSLGKENVEIHVEEDSDAAYVPTHSAAKVRGLAALKRFSNDDEESPKRTSEQQVNNCDTYVYSTNSRELCTNQKSRLANLAANIRQWEDDTRQPTLSSNNVTSNNYYKDNKIPFPLTNTPNSAAKSTFSMKVYYTNTTPNVSNSGKQHAKQNSLSNNFMSGGDKGLKSVSACNRGNIEVGSVGGRQKNFQAWNQAVTAVLETPTSVKSPVKALSGTSNKEISQNLNQDLHEEESSDDESIDADDFDENYSDVKSDAGSNKMEWDYSPVKEVKKQEKLSEPAKTETALEKPNAPNVQESIPSNVDPAELPLSARKALFEKALLSGTPKVNDNVVDQKLSVAQRAAMFENASKTNSRVKNAGFKEPNRIAPPNFPKFNNNSNTQSAKSPVKTVVKPNYKEMKASPIKKTSAVVTSTPSPTKNIGSHTRLIQQKLLESTGSVSQEKEVAKAVEERKREISSLVNHWEKISSSSSAETNSETEQNNLATEEKISFESDAPQEEEFEEDSDYDDVVDRENVDNEVDTNADEGDQDVEDGNECEELENAENVFYEQEEEEEERGDVKPIETKYFNEERADILSYSSNTNRSGSSLSASSYAEDSNSASISHSCSSGSSVRSYNVSPRPESNSMETSGNTRESKNPEIPLLYTVSFYRKQKQESRLTPVRTIVRREKVSSPESPPDTDYTEIIQQRLKGLQEEILRQQTVISQTSQALNLCSATAEFSGSTEQVEGERLLLIATQKRQACLNEMTRLKTCGAQGENVAEGTGTLTITDLQLPLKREFIASQLEGKGNDTVHYFLCLIRHGAQVIVTQMMSSDDKTSNGTLCFTNHIQLRDLPADFSVVFEVYALQTKKEVLPHEKKYHIRREHSKIRLTPKGRKGDGKLPAISSPGGPNAVRSPSFGVVGFTRFTLQNCNKKAFSLDKVPYSSPLEGVLRVQLQLHAEHKVLEKGFLTMFEDVSGFGAWHRRWCVLNVNNVAYWKYPDDEQKKEPIGVIDLRQCVTGLVKLVSRDVCARPHTFQVVTVRPQKKGDKNTLISRSVNTLTTTKYLLSADTKDERILWCNKLNEALTNVRKWDPQALRPMSSMQD